MAGPEPLRADGADVDTLRQFVTIDLLGAVAGFVAVVLLNGLIFRVGGVWAIQPFLAVLVGSLLFARRLVSRGRVTPALWAVAVGNWQVAIAVAIVLPFLWPVMVLAVVMPIVVAAPYLDTEALVPWLALTAIVGGVMAIIGLTNGDGGAVPDIDAAAELFIVAGGLAALFVPVGLIVWQHSHRQQRSQDALVASQRRVVEASDVERSRIERDLHDGAQQRLVAIGLQLQLLAGEADDDPDLRASVERLAADLSDAIGELRELAHGIYPPVLEANGLGAALGEVARRSPSDVSLEVLTDDRFPRATESTLYFVALEALANVSKHAAGAPARVRLARDESVVELTITDAGPGFDVSQQMGRGLLNMEDRLRAIGGMLAVATGSGGGTVVRARVVPVPPSSGPATPQD